MRANLSSLSMETSSRSADMLPSLQGRMRESENPRIRSPEYCT